MQIQNPYFYTPNFQSRNKEIRDADKIMRNASNNYPMISTSRAVHYNVYKKNPDWGYLKAIGAAEKIAALRDKTYGMKEFKYLDTVMKELKKYKTGNCGEMTKIMQAAFLANGYKDVKNVILFKKLFFKNQDIDHAFLLVNAGEKANLEDLSTINKHAFIVDPWLGFVDYVPNAITKYKDFFPQCSDYIAMDGKIIKSKLYLAKNPVKTKVENKNCEKFARKYPELVVNNDKPRKKFFGLF